MKGTHAFVSFVAGIVILVSTCARSQTSTSVLAYYASDTCEETPNRVDIGANECDSSCTQLLSDWKSLQGFCDTVDSRKVISEAFKESSYILVEAFNDTNCTTFQDATAFQATGKCTQIITFIEEWNFAVYAIANEDANSVSIRYFNDSFCESPLLESLPLIEGVLTQNIDVDVISPACDKNNHLWTYYPGSNIISSNVDHGSGSKLSPASSSSSGSNVNLVAGLGGGVVGLVGFVVCVFICCRRRRGTTSANTYGHYIRHSDQQRSSSLPPSPYGGEMAAQEGLWSDDVITAKRITRRFVETKELISRGAFGEVYMGIFKGTPVAVKMLPPENQVNIHHVNAFLAEAKLTAMMNHPRIITLVGVAWNSLSDLCVVMEYMGGGDLRSLLTDYEKASHPVGFDRQKATIALHVCHALTYLHSLSPIVIHRDLKSRNILLNRDLEAKLTDFGISREQFDQTMTAGVGTSLWMAPEVMLGEKYDEKADMFSFGVILSELDLHSVPYAQSKESVDSNGKRLPDAVLLQQIATGKLRVNFSPSSSPSIVQLGKACISMNPSQRPTAEEALYTLQIIPTQELK